MKLKKVNSNSRIVIKCDKHKNLEQFGFFLLWLVTKTFPFELFLDLLGVFQQWKKQGSRDVETSIFTGFFAYIRLQQKPLLSQKCNESSQLLCPEVFFQLRCLVPHSKTSKCACEKNNTFMSEWNESWVYYWLRRGRSLRTDGM